MLRETRVRGEMEKRRRLFPALFVLMFGFLSALNIIGNPRFANYRAVDIVHVLGTGMCFGAAIALFASLRSTRGRDAT